MFLCEANILNYSYCIKLLEMYTEMFPHGFDALIIMLDNMLSLGRTACWSVLRAISSEKERQSMWSTASLWASAVLHQYLILRDALLTLEEVEP